MAVSLVTACAAQPIQWHKPGISDAEAQSEVTECQYEAQLNRLEDATLAGLINTCMVGKGFRTKVPSP